MPRKDVFTYLKEPFQIKKEDLLKCLEGKISAVSDGDPIYIGNLCYADFRWHFLVESKEFIQETDKEKIKSGIFGMWRGHPIKVVSQLTLSAYLDYLCELKRFQKESGGL